MGIMAAAQAVGVSIGPMVGGALLAALDWRWVFWVSVPFALAGAILGWFVVPQTAERSQDRRFDWRGAVLLMPGLAFLLLAITESVNWGATSPAILGSALAAIVLLTLFVRQECRTRGAARQFRICSAAFRSPAASSRLSCPTRCCTRCCL